MSKIQNRLQAALALHQSGSADAAETAYREILRKAPRNPEALHYLGVLLHQQGRNTEALPLVEKALRSKPGTAAMLNTLGEIQRALGRHEAAAASYRRAVKLKPDFAAAHSNLGLALLALGRTEEAIAAFGRATRLRPDHAPAHYNLGMALHRLGDLANAAAAYRRALHFAPDAPQVHVNLALVLMAQGFNEDAEASLRAALERAPGMPEALVNLASLWRDQGRLDEALAACREVLAANPEHGPARVEAAAILDLLGRPAEAAEQLEPVVRGPRPAAPAAAAYAAACRQLGRGDDALEAIAAALGNGAASDDERSILLFERGRLLDEAGRYDAAFAAFEEANRLHPRDFDPAAHDAMIESLIAAFDRSALAALPRSSRASELPVFIVGMPRSGTSLVEQILAAHPDIFGAGERDDVNRLVNGLPPALGGREPYPQCVAALTAPLLDDIAARHLDALAAIAPEARRITDKMPTNFLHLGLIALLFPGARVIHCRRDPVDTCLSCFFQRFSGRHPYTYDLGDLAFYYRSYRRLMRHWRETLDLAILDVDYEALVADTEGKSREVIDFLGLEWSPDCLDFHRSGRVALTASYDQVRQPIYDRSVGRGRHYAQHIGALREALEGATNG